jgi:hypothetical protein
MKTREFRGPPPAKMFGKGTFDFLNQPSARNSYLAAWLDKPCEVVQVEIVRPVVAEGINTHDGVEELRCERQRPGIGVEGNTPSSTPASRIRWTFSETLNHRSVAQTCTPNSRRRKIDDAKNEESSWR